MWVRSPYQRFPSAKRLSSRGAKPSIRVRADPRRAKQSDRGQTCRSSKVSHSGSSWVITDTTSAEGMPTQAVLPVPDDDKPPTQEVTPVAWSEEKRGEEPGRSWQVAWRDVAIIVVAALTVAVAAGFGLWALP